MFSLHPHLWTMYIPWYIGKERVLDSSETGVRDGSQMPCGFW